MTIRLAVVDCHPLIVAGLQVMLEPHTDRVEIAQIVPTISAASGVDVLLVDDRADLPGHLIGGQSGAHGRAKVVLFGWEDTKSPLASGDAGGADGYIPKTVSAEEFLESIEEVQQGERATDAPTGGPWAGAQHGLSKRESEVLALVCQGLSNQEIAERVYISVNTVKTYIRSCYRKISVDTRSKAVIWGLNNGFHPVSR